MMYDELIEELRRHHCDAKEDDTQEICEECAYDVIIADKSVPSGIASVCVCGLMNRAADAIEDLITALTASNEVIAKSKPKWIPVTERLPKYGTKVLVFAYGHDVLTARLCKEPENDYPVFDCNGIYNELAKLGRITHWMPLPEPPKDGE